MKKWIILLLIFLINLVGGHFVVLNALPSIIMSKAMDRMTSQGIILHQFTLAPRATPQTQSVVRPSPDLAYSICPYDFSKLQGSLEIYVGAWDEYGSVSFFDANTNNFATIRVPKQTDGGLRIILEADNSAKSEAQSVFDKKIVSPTRKGLILIRRLAPTQLTYELVSRLAQSDRCVAIESKAP